jgi:hypothetical protein
MLVRKRVTTVELTIYHNVYPLVSGYMEAYASTSEVLIWPLPGETLESFRSGVEELCASRAQCIFVYAPVVLRNTDCHRRQEELGFVLEPLTTEFSEVDIITSTREVSYHEYREGVSSVLPSWAPTGVVAQRSTRLQVVSSI